VKGESKPGSPWAIAQLLWWPGVFFVGIGIVRWYKFRLPASEVPGFLLQDGALAGLLFLLLYGLQRAFQPGRLWPRMLLFLPIFWVSLFGMVATGLLGLPVNVKLFLQLPSLMFLRSALGADAVYTSVIKLSIVAVAIPLAGGVGAYFLEKKSAKENSLRLPPMLLIAVFVASVFGAMYSSDARARDTNAVITIVSSSVQFLGEASETGPFLSPEEFDRKIAQLEDSTEGSVSQTLANLRFDGTQYDVLLYVLETGVAGIMNLETADDRWLPNLRRIAAQSLQLRRHLTPGPNSTKAVFGLISSRYPAPNYLSFIRTWPTAPFETFVSILGKEGYRTALYASIDGDYDRMDTFLSHHGVQHQRDKRSLGLTLLSDPTFGSDKEMIDHFLNWIEQEPERPYLFTLLPSNSHWPFFFPDEDALFNTDDRTARYKNSLQTQDRLIGQLYQALADKHRLEQTIIIFLPDHGGYFNLTGGFAGDESKISQYHVPAFIDHPKLRSHEPPPVIMSATSHVDIGPTVLAMCSASPVPTDMQGVSLLALPPGKRLVFFSEDFGKSLVNATDGSRIVQWNRTTDSFTGYQWTGNSIAEPVDSLPDAGEIKNRIKLFYGYQLQLLKALANQSHHSYVEPFSGDEK